MAVDGTGDSLRLIAIGLGLLAAALAAGRYFWERAIEKRSLQKTLAIGIFSELRAMNLSNHYFSYTNFEEVKERIKKEKKYNPMEINGEFFTPIFDEQKKSLQMLPSFSVPLILKAYYDNYRLHVISVFIESDAFRTQTEEHKILAISGQEALLNEAIRSTDLALKCLAKYLQRRFIDAPEAAPPGLSQFADDFVEMLICRLFCGNA